MDKILSKYLGRGIHYIMSIEPIKNFRWNRSVDDELDEVEIRYVCSEFNFELHCTKSEILKAIIIEGRSIDKFGKLWDLPDNRTSAHALLGIPERSNSYQGILIERWVSSGEKGEITMIRFENELAIRFSFFLITQYPHMMDG